MKLQLARSVVSALGHVSIAFGALGLTSGGDPIIITSSEGVAWLVAGLLSLSAAVVLSMTLEGR